MAAVNWKYTCTFIHCIGTRIEVSIMVPMVTFVAIIVACFGKEE